MSGSERVNTTSSGSGRVDDIQGHPQGGFRGQTKLVNITEDVRKHAAEQRVNESEAFAVGLREKAKEFVEKGPEVFTAKCS